MGKFTLDNFAAINPTIEQCELVREMVNKYFEWGNSAHCLVRQTPSELYKMFCDYTKHELDYDSHDVVNSGLSKSNIKLFVVNACWNTLHGFITLEQLNSVAYGGEQ